MPDYGPNADTPVCPICLGRKFREHNGRQMACCASCGSLERTRFVWLVLNRIGLLKTGLSVLHVAPERALATPFLKLTDNYLCCDIDPAGYGRFPIPVEPIDVSSVAEHFGPGRFDLVIHNHVLEHVRCDVGEVLQGIDQILKPGGCQVFTIPFRGEETVEDYSDELTGEDRRQLFGQQDHVRMFGRQDFPALLYQLFGAERINWDWSSIMTSEILQGAAVPPNVLFQLTGESVFRCRKLNESG